MPEQHRIVIIGAGPSGAIAAAILKRKGHNVLVLEKQQFPRFSIGESLLPHCLDFIEEAGMLDKIEQYGFQIKNGAAFALDDAYSIFDFSDAFTDGKKYAYEVRRAEFDQLLADCATEQGVEIRYQHEIIATDFQDSGATLTVKNNCGEVYQIETKFVLDASGYGRVLARLLDLETPSVLPVRQAVFTHIEDRITHPSFERDKILITVHPEAEDIWFWLIPFSDGRSSLGVVGLESYFDRFGDDLSACLHHFVDTTPSLKRVINDAVWDTPCNKLHGYSANVKQLYGPHFALLGNSAEFLDPVFSSGVTIAMHGASLAANLLDRQLQGETVDWKTEFAEPLQKGVDTFKTYVMGWYNLSFQKAVFWKNKNKNIEQMICSILAGYAWDENNPFVADHQNKLKALSLFCQET